MDAPAAHIFRSTQALLAAFDGPSAGDVNSPSAAIHGASTVSRTVYAPAEPAVSLSLACPCREKRSEALLLSAGPFSLPDSGARVHRYSSQFAQRAPPGAWQPAASSGGRLAWGQRRGGTVMSEALLALDAHRDSAALASQAVGACVHRRIYLFERGRPCAVDSVQVLLLATPAFRSTTYQTQTHSHYPTTPGGLHCHRPQVSLHPRCPRRWKRSTVSRRNGWDRD